jgi:phosphoglycerol transferase MdoB-like AlkP superfamily enzyme
MRWLLIVLLSLLGVLLGLLNLLGLAEGAMAWVFSIVLWLVMAILIGHFAGGKYFLHGFLTGIIFALINSVIVYLFYDTYMANSTAMQEAMSKMPEGYNMRTVMLAGAPINAGIAGVVLGLLSILGGKLFGVKKAETPAPEPPKSGPAA